MRSGGGGFPRNINIGHEHLNIVNGLTYQYQGDSPDNSLNWKIIGGSLNTDPSTIGWGSKQLGAMWFNKSEKVFKYWNGLNVIILGQLTYPSYIGLVATRCMMPILLNTTNRQLMARSPHYMREDVSSIQIEFPNFYVNPNTPHNELGTGSAATITASIEFPAGVFTQVLFSGNPSGTIANSSTLLSDSVAITLSRGDLIWIRAFFVSTTGILSIPHNLTGTGLPGSGLEVAVSGLTDKTMSGTVTAANNEYSPVAIIGTTTRASVVIIGDSIGLGDSSKETVGNASGDFGIIARSLGPDYAYGSYCQNGDRGEDFVASHTNRLNLLNYATHLVCEYGSNDLYSAAHSAEVVLANLQTIWGYATSLGKVACQSLIPVRTTSTDNWATIVNQSIVSGNVQRLILNAAIQLLPSGLSRCFNIPSVLENEGVWVVNGTPNAYTSDGTHPNTNGSLLIPPTRIVTLK